MEEAARVGEGLLDGIDKMSEWAAGAAPPQMEIATAGGSAPPRQRAARREKSEAELIAQNNRALAQLAGMMGNVPGGLGVMPGTAND